MEPQKIYIAGPYSSNIAWQVERNVEAAMDAARDIYERGHYPYCPHLTHYLHTYFLEVYNDSLTYEQWMDFDSVWVTACDALLYLGPSKGADRELSQALREGKKIYYAVAEIPNVEETRT